MPNVGRYRHIGYADSGKLLMRRLLDVDCADLLPSSPEFQAGRYIGLTPSLKKLFAYCWECCDAVCPDDTTLDSCYNGQSCYVHDVLWPVGDGPGILRKIAFYVSDASTCWSARGKRGYLCYNAVTDKWEGDFTIRGGTVSLEFSVNAGPVDDPSKFTLAYSTTANAYGETDSGSIDQGADCIDPLLIAFVQFQVPISCECWDVQTPSSPPNPERPITDTTSQIQVSIATNCHKLVIARHIGYTSDGKLLMARTLPCTWDQTDEDDLHCGSMTCGIKAIVSSVDCPCYDDTYNLDYLTGSWQSVTQFINCGAGPGGTISVTCTDLADDGTGVPKVRLSLSFDCGADHSGSATKDIPAADLEDLDETLAVSVIDAGGGDPDCCAGTVSVRLMR